MNEMEIKAKVEELVHNAELMKKLENAESAEEAAALFREQGVEVTAEEIEKIAESMNEQGELGEKDLDAVAGGVFPIGAAIGLMVVSSVLAYGGAYAMSNFCNPWIKKKKKR